MRFLGYTIWDKYMPYWKKGAIIGAFLFGIGTILNYYIPAVFPHTAIPLTSITYSIIPTIGLTSLILDTIGAMIFGGLLIGTLSWLYLNRERLKSTKGIGAIFLALFLIFLTPLNPLSPFTIPTPPPTTTLEIGVGNIGYEVTCQLDVDLQPIIWSTGSKYCKTTTGKCIAYNIKTSVPFNGWCSCLSSTYKLSGYTNSYLYYDTRWTPPWKILLGASLNCQGCTSGQRRCSGNTIQECQNNEWIFIQKCDDTAGYQCIDSGNNNVICKFGGCTAGYKCKDSQNYGYQNADCTWTDLRTCYGGCINNICNAGCAMGYKCKDSMTYGYQKSDCSWTNLRTCSGGCWTDVDGDAHCETITTTTTTTTTTPTTTPTTTIPTTTTTTPITTTTTPITTTTTPTTTTTTTPQDTCNQNCIAYDYTSGICSQFPTGNYHLIGDFCPSGLECWCSSGITTTTIITTTTTIPSCIPGQSCYLPDGKIGICKQGYYTAISYCAPKEPPEESNYLLYGGVGIIIILMGIVGYLFIIKKKRK